MQPQPWAGPAGKNQLGGTPRVWSRRAESKGQEEQQEAQTVKGAKQEPLEGGNTRQAHKKRERTGSTFTSSASRSYHRLPVGRVKLVAYLVEERRGQEVRMANHNNSHVLFLCFFFFLSLLLFDCRFFCVLLHTIHSSIAKKSTLVPTMAPRVVKIS